MKYAILSIITHSVLFLYFYPDSTYEPKKQVLTEKVSEIKVNLKIIQLKEEEKPIESNNLGNISSQGEKGKVSEAEGIEYIDVKALRMKYFSFYLRSKNIIDYHWQKTLTNYFPKEKQINVYFELMKDGLVGDIIIISEDENYSKELMKNFSSLRISNPPRELFDKSNSMYLRWVFETK